MTKVEISQAKKRMSSLMIQIQKTLPLMRGNIVTNGAKNKQAYFSLNKDHKTHLIYLGEKRLPQAKKMSDNYKKCWSILEEMTTINMALLKNDALL